MSKSELTLEIEDTVLKQFSKPGTFICQEVSFQRPWIDNEPVNESISEFETNPKYNQISNKYIRTEILDVLQLDCQRGYICYEIKISKSDFNSKAIKSFVGDYNYYVMPEDLYIKVKNIIPNSIGCYVYKNKSLSLVKKSRHNDKVAGIKDQLNYGMIRALSREREKAKYYSYEKSPSRQRLEIVVKDITSLIQDIDEEYANLCKSSQDESDLVFKANKKQIKDKSALLREILNKLNQIYWKGGE